MSLEFVLQKIRTQILEERQEKELKITRHLKKIKNKDNNTFYYETRVNNTQIQIGFMNTNDQHIQNYLNSI